MRCILYMDSSTSSRMFELLNPSIFLILLLNPSVRLVVCVFIWWCTCTAYQLGRKIDMRNRKEINKKKTSYNFYTVQFHSFIPYTIPQHSYFLPEARQLARAWLLGIGSDKNPLLEFVYLSATPIVSSLWLTITFIPYLLHICCCLGARKHRITRWCWWDQHVYTQTIIS